MRSTLLRRVLFGPSVELSPGLLLAAEGPGQAPVNLDRLLGAIVRGSRCAGMAALALRGDRTIAQGVAGVRRKGFPEPIALGDQFHLGSCGKAMTATLVAMLIEEGKLNWTSTLGEIFGGTIEAMHPAWMRVTVSHLLAHRAGLRRGPGRTLWKRLTASSEPLPAQRREIVATILSRAPKIAPDTKAVYSNVGYIMLGAILELVSGRAWEELMQERLFRPLGITTGGFGPPGTGGRIDQPWGHFPILGKPLDPGGRQAELPRFYGPAGLAHMTMTDWGKFIALHLRGDPSNPNRRVTLLQSNTFAKLHPATRRERYFAGWCVRSGEWASGGQAGSNRLILWHSGSNLRWCCFVWIAPEIDLAILVACNRGWGFTSSKVCLKAGDALVQAFAAKPPAAK